MYFNSSLARSIENKNQIYRKTKIIKRLLHSNINVFVLIIMIIVA